MFHDKPWNNYQKYLRNSVLKMQMEENQLWNKRIKEWIVIFLTFVLIVIIVSTFILDEKKNNWVFGPVLVIQELIAMVLQGLFILAIWKIEKQSIKTILTIISFSLLTLIVWNFINFLTNCS